MNEVLEGKVGIAGTAGTFLKQAVPRREDVSGGDTCKLYLLQTGLDELLLKSYTMNPLSPLFRSMGSFWVNGLLQSIVCCE